MIRPVRGNNQQPTFLLKNVVPSELYAKYKQGFFNRPIPVKSKIKIVKPQINTSSVNEDKIKPIEVSGKENVEIFKNNNCRPLMGGRCTYCKCDFQTEQIGYPIAYECKQLSDEECQGPAFNKTVHVFWVEDCFHSYECCLGYLLLINTGYIKDSLMIDAEVMLKFMYQLSFVNAGPLIKAKDPKLLISNGGSMTLEDWSNPNTSYIRTNSVIKIPAQVVYTCSKK